MLFQPSCLMFYQWWIHPPTPCNKCEYQATRTQYLRRHIQSIHNGFRHACTPCDYESTTKDSLTEHLWSIHGRWPDVNTTMCAPMCRSTHAKVSSPESLAISAVLIQYRVLVDTPLSFAVGVTAKIHQHKKVVTLFVLPFVGYHMPGLHHKTKLFSPFLFQQ